MAYTIKSYSNTPITTVNDGTVDTTLDIKLIGKNFAGYGEAQNENFVYLLENFAGPTPPPRKVRGQLWYDSTYKKLKFYDGANFRATGGAEVSDTTAPTGQTEGDFWWDSNLKQLWAYVDDTTKTGNGTHYVLVGPQKTVANDTEMRSMTVKDTTNVTRNVLVAIVAGSPTCVISNETANFSIATGVITGFTTVKPGINFADSTVIKYWGKAENSDKLNGLSASSYVQTSGTTFTGEVSFSNNGLKVGASNSNQLKISIDTVSNVTIPIISNIGGSKIVFKTMTGSPASLNTALTIDGTTIMPGDLNGGSNIGSPSQSFGIIYASSFNGIATKADTLKVGTNYVGAAEAATASTIVARDSNADVNARIFNGTASKAYYADLAEKYLPDADYEVGTVVIVGGEKEITASTLGKRALGVVSGNPAYMMNSELAGGVYIALKGRVPVKVSGPVSKGDRLVASNNGTAQVGINSSDVFAIALESSDDHDVKMIEAVVL